LLTLGNLKIGLEVLKAPGNPKKLKKKLGQGWEEGKGKLGFFNFLLGS